VRLDTAADMIDESVFRAVRERMEAARGETTGVTPRLVRAVRDALDAEGFDAVRIVVSGGMTVAKIRGFESEGLPVAAYGVGSELYDRAEGRFEYTEDVVLPVAKQGRRYIESDRLRPQDLPRLAAAAASLVP
jgi:nicotinate phosphoribosyltransferase